MTELNKLFISTFEPTMTAKGFKRKGIVFHRIRGEKIIQLISTTSSKYSFTIQYLILPLCMGWEFNAYVLDMPRIGSLVGSEVFFEWDIDDNIAESVTEAYNKCEEHLFEWFDYVKDYKTYSNYLLIFHEKYLKRQKEEYLKAKAEFIRVPEGGFYEVSLALGEYDNAKASLEQQLYQINYAIMQWKSRGIESTKRDFDMQNEVMTKISKIADYKNGISSPEQLLAENEEKCLNSYLKRFC